MENAARQWRCKALLNQAFVFSTFSRGDVQDRQTELRGRGGTTKKVCGYVTSVKGGYQMQLHLVAFATICGSAQQGGAMWFGKRPMLTRFESSRPD
jgi:hypothetical protein